jgi:hypothetical protein
MKVPIGIKKYRKGIPLAISDSFRTAMFLDYTLRQS